VRKSLHAKITYDLSLFAIKILPEFPMTPTGKISKAQLSEQLTGHCQTNRSSSLLGAAIPNPRGD
jgi:hypothetical protein